MCLAREHELDRLPGVAGQVGDGLDVRQHEIRPFVDREPPREADGQRVEAKDPSTNKGWYLYSWTGP